MTQKRGICVKIIDILKLISRYRLRFMKIGKGQLSLQKIYIGNCTEKFGITNVILFILFRFWVSVDEVCLTQYIFEILCMIFLRFSFLFPINNFIFGHTRVCIQVQVLGLQLKNRNF